MYVCICQKSPQKCDQLSCEYVSCVSYVSCTICIICNKCICVFFQVCTNNVTNYFVTLYLLYHMYHVPYVSYVTNVFGYFPKFVPKMRPTILWVCFMCIICIMYYIMYNKMYLSIFPNFSQKCDQLFWKHVSCVSYVSCTICFIRNKCQRQHRVVVVVVVVPMRQCSSHGRPHATKWSVRTS